MQRTRTAHLLVAAALVLSSFAAAGDPIAEQGRAILGQHRDAVITVRAVLGIAFGGRPESEQEREANGTVIAPDGLTVLALTALDPSIMMQRLHGAQAEAVSKVTSLKMILGDGTEIDGEIVLRDRDLDLVFVRPVTKPASPMPYVDLEDTAQPQVLDHLVFIGQLGKVARRAHIVFVERVQAVVDRPLTFYVVGEDRNQAVACSPAFTLDGAFVGVGVLRAIRSTSAGAMGDNPMVVVCDAQDIKTAMTQVPEWKEGTAAEPPSEEPGEPEEDAGEEAGEEAA
jgi:hypothetical protein